MNYEEKIKEILKSEGISVDIIFVTNSYPKWDKNILHNQYKVVLKRGNKQMQYDFWDSLYNTEKGLKPSKYDVMSCLEWYEIYDFEDFCMNFGCDTDSIKAFETYKECQKQQKELFELIPEEEIRNKIRDII